MDRSPPPPRPAEIAENRLIEAILNGTFPPGSTLPNERDLATRLGITRPTLREALQRLARDGWVEIHHGKPTRVRDYWREGNLNILSALINHPEVLPPTFIPDLLQVRVLLAPAYCRLAFERARDEVKNLLEALCEVPDEADAFAVADWQLHHTLTVLSGNPVFTLILNGFRELYLTMAQRYFARAAARARSRAYYEGLLEYARQNQPEAAEALTRAVMLESIRLWETLAHNGHSAA
ncbi:fatty acid metabolism transcriptional regulator FadR [uncultured Thermanaerothrix sp.]|uniref:fatty acid metabolism transcriptional regulator FadR n=1 Tax=uncultured Thermanaerothrix sp. TaxID=1195149 RepID=UPI0026209451|nr:fatty acid metabolism transcriptional regulator FadR [uncultured Thermanaerothrix sp.]